MCTDSESSVKKIESGKFQGPILNEIYDIAAELREQRKQITLCKVRVHTGIVWNKKIYKAIRK